MQKSLVLFLLLGLLLLGCAETTTPGTGNAAYDAAKGTATGLTVLHNALALAQVGYQDYALIAGKTADPKTQAAMQVIDGQLNVLGTLAYNTVNPSPADIAKSQAALADVQQAKVDIK